MNKEHIVWVDLLRVVACFLVIVSHSCDPFVGQFDNNPSEFFSGALIGSLVRPCVPLFVMMSGVLLLPIKMDMGTFYAKRTKRLLIPFVFWSVVLPFLYFLYVHSGITIVNPNLIVEDHTLGLTLQKFYTFLFNFNYDTIPLWYIYMLIGLYLFMPIISAWLTQVTQKEVKWFLWIWIASMCLPLIQIAAPYLGYTGNYEHMGLLGVCDWNPYGTFYYFSGFLGYIVLAYYLVKYPLNWSWSRTLGVALPLFVIGYVVTAGGFILTQKYYPGSYANLEILWYFSGINVFAMTFAIFIVVQKIRMKGSATLNKIANLTFGIYLCHFIFVELVYDLLYPATDAPVAIKITLIAVFSFAISLFVAWLLSLNKVTRKTVM